jgi:hypothetical protein
VTPDRDVFEIAEVRLTATRINIEARIADHVRCEYSKRDAG